MLHKKKKKKPKPPRGKKPKPGKPTPKPGKSTATGSAGPGGTMNSISSTLSFSIDATAVAIDVGTLEATVSGANVSWNGVTIFSTNAWDDPLLNQIACSCTPNMPSVLKITLIYPTGNRVYQKPNIYPTSSGHPTVALSPV